MDIIELARELGKKIQEEESYVKLKVAQQKSDEDEVLQDMIEDFNLKRLAINNESSKDNKDLNKLEQLNKELREIYDNIMNNGNMVAYNVAKKDFEVIMNRINAIIIQSAQGQDPQTADYQESCGESCSSCAGCH